MSACGIASNWRGLLERPVCCDAEKERDFEAATAVFQDALNEGFTDFVIIGMVAADPNNPGDYVAKVFSRPRPREVLLNIINTGRVYVAQYLVGQGSAN